MELNFLFGNPVKGKKGGKGMAAKKRSAAKAKPKRRRSAKKNPIKAGYVGATRKVKDDQGNEREIKTLKGIVKPPRSYATKAELALLKRTLESKVKGARKPKIKASAEEISTLDALFPPQYDKKGNRISSLSDIVFGGTAEIEKYSKLKKKLQEAKSKADAANAKRIQRAINKVDDELLRLKRSGETLDSKEQLARYKYILSNLSKLDEDRIVSDGWQEVDLDRTASEWSQADMNDALFKELEKEIKASKGGLTRSDLVKELLRKAGESDIEELISKVQNPRRKKGMAKKRRKSKGAKVAYKKRRKKGAKVAHKKRRRKSKSAKIAAAIAAAQAGHKKRRKKRRGSKRSHKRRNPIGGGMMKELAMIAAAGAAASLAVGLVSKLAKPLVDKLPSAITGLKVGNVAVGQLAISALIPAGLYMVMKKSKMPFLDKAADVLAVVTAANIGGRLASAVLPGGMIAGVEPVLMGVEPELMGNADFGDADFGAIEQFSGVEPVLMGSADFGAIEQFSGHDAASLGAVQLHGDEDYAGEDDMDGESDFGLG